MTNTTLSTPTNSTFDHDVLTFMRQQEMESYISPRKYWEVAFQEGTVSLLPDEDEDEGQPEVDNTMSTYLKRRNQMITWFLQVRASCQYQLDTCEIALNMVDRYMAYSPKGNTIMKQSEQYQLICMTCMYIAAKIHEQECLTIQHLVDFFDRGQYVEEDFLALEMEILEELDWQVNPPTCMAFVRSLVDLIPDHTLEDKSCVLQLAQEQIVQSLTSYRFLPTKNSTIAFCAVMNAIQCTPDAQNDVDVSFQLHRLLRTALHLDQSSTYNTHLESVQEALYIFIAHIAEYDEEDDSLLTVSERTLFIEKSTTTAVKSVKMGSSINDSPTSVSATAAYKQTAGTALIE
jgi:hypothetical protein